MSHRYYLDDDNQDALCDAGSGSDHDLVEDIPSGGTIAPSTSSTSFVQVATWDRLVKDDNPGGGSFAITLNPFLLSTDAEYRVRVSAVDKACAVVGSSAYSAAFTDASLQNFNLALASWPVGAIRLRLELELRSTGTGSKQVQFRPIGENFLDAPFLPKVPRIRQITNAVLARLAKIAVLRGHNFDIGNNGLKRPDLGLITKTPAVFVWNEEFVQRQFRNVGDGPLAREAAALLELRLFTRGTTAPQDMILLGSDVVDTLEDLPLHLGLEAFVVRYILSNLQALKTEQPIEEPWHVATMLLEVLYRMPRGEI
jgi:hypothetical protein